jgi:hyperosmotically inducible periplasmic protein
MKRLVINSLVCAALLAIAGCSSTMVPEKTRDLDSAISSKIDESLEDSTDVKARQVNIQTHEGVVYLTGVVDSEDARREAGRIAWRTAGVDGVVNDLTVGERTVGDWVDDTLISSRLKAQLIAVSSSQGVVTLIGRVRTSAMKQDAERIARGIKGVTGVHNELVVGRVIG